MAEHNMQMMDEQEHVEELERVEQMEQWSQWANWDAWKEWDNAGTPKRRQKKTRKFRYKKQCPLEYYSEREFKAHFGFTKQHFKIVLDRLLEDLEGPQSHRRNALTPSSKLAIFLFSTKGNILQR